jgi:hypothetical protein
MGERRIGEDLEGSGRGLIYMHYPGTRLEGLGKITNISDNNRRPVRDSNQSTPEYKSMCRALPLDEPAR